MLLHGIIIKGKHNSSTLSNLTPHSTLTDSQKGVLSPPLLASERQPTTTQILEWDIVGGEKCVVFCELIELQVFVDGEGSD